MIARANTTLDVLRGTTTDALGDTRQASTVVYEGIPASLLEQSQTTTRRADNRRQTMRYYTVRLSPIYALLVGDRVRDAAGTVYVVDDITEPTSPIGTPTQRLRLRRAT